MELIFNGPQDGPLFLFAHGAGAPADSEFMETIAQGLAMQGVRVARFNFNYMQQRIINGTRRPPERAPKLIAQFSEIINDLNTPMIIGGKSMGGRMATMLLAELDANETKNVKGVACLGFPFHPTGKPEKLRTEHFKSIKHPIMIIQGERDNMGTKAEVTDYRLPNSIEWLWLDDGDHNLKPRIKSGYTQQQHLSQAIDSLVIFIKNNINKSPNLSNIEQ